VAVFREWTIPTERPHLVGEVSANFCGDGVAWSAQRIPTAVPRLCGLQGIRHADYAANRNLGFLNRRPHFFDQVASELYSRGWLHPVPDYYYPENRTRTLRVCSQELWPLDHRGGLVRTVWNIQIHSMCRKQSLSTLKWMVYTQRGAKKCTHSLIVNIFGTKWHVVTILARYCSVMFAHVSRGCRAAWALRAVDSSNDGWKVVFWATQGCIEVVLEVRKQ
jgi:hypothetical protein